MTVTFIDSLPNCEDVGICNLSWCHASRTVYRAVVTSDECWKNVYVSIGVFVGKVLVQFFTNSALNFLYYSTLDVRIPTDLKLIPSRFNTS
jgi:hypothetical protein